MGTIYTGAIKGAEIDDIAISLIKTWSSSKINTEINAKIDLPETWVNGEIVEFDFNGGLVSSGKTVNDFAPVSHVHSAAQVTVNTNNFGNNLSPTDDNVQKIADAIDDLNISDEFIKLNDTPSSYSGQAGKTVSVNGTEDGLEFSDAGAGDMTKAIYDPTNVSGDAFDMDNMVEGTTNKILSQAERDKLAQTETSTQLDSRDTANRNTDNHTDGITTKVFRLQDKRSISDSAVTGFLEGGAISINAGDNTTFDIAPFKAQFVDHTAGTITILENLTGFTGVTPTVAVGTTGTDVFLESNGTLSYGLGATFKQQRTKIIFARLGVPLGQGTQIQDIFQRYQTPIDSDLSSRNALDLIAPVINVDGGNIYTPNGANLLLNKSAGQFFERGVNFANDIENPDIITTPAETGLSFRYVSVDALGNITVSPLRTTIDPTLYEDLSGTLKTVPNNKFTVQRIYLTSNNLTLIEYGQKIYDNLNDAKLDIGTSGHQKILPGTSLLRAGLTVKQTTVNLSNTANAQFLLADEVGKLGGGGSTASSGIDLQTSYNQSIQPQIVTDATHLAVQIQQGSGADTDKVFEILNGAGSTTFSVDGNGDAIANTFNGVALTTGGSSIAYLSADGTYTTPAGGGGGGLRETIQVAGTQTVNTILYEGAIGAATTLSAGYITLLTAPTGSSFIVTVSKSTDSGATYPTSETVTLTATNKYVKGTLTTAFVEGDFMKIEVTQVGSSVAGAGLTFTVVGS